MAVCKDCLHYDVCYIIEEYGDDGETSVEYNCTQFKYRNEYEKVVRCKDCKHYELDACLKIYQDGNVSNDAWQERKPTDFCSYAEPRMDGE